MLASSSLEVVATFSSPSFVSMLMAVSLRQYRGFDPSGSLQLPIKESDRDQCSISLRQMACFFLFLYSIGGSKILNSYWIGAALLPLEVSSVARKNDTKTLTVLSIDLASLLAIASG